MRQGFEQDFSWLHKIQAAPEVRPTVEEFEDFPGLMDRIVKEGRPAGQQPSAKQLDAWLSKLVLADDLGELQGF